MAPEQGATMVSMLEKLPAEIQYMIMDNLPSEPICALGDASRTLRPLTMYYMQRDRTPQLGNSAALQQTLEAAIKASADLDSLVRIPEDVWQKTTTGPELLAFSGWHDDVIDDNDDGDGGTTESFLTLSNLGMVVRGIEGLHLAVCPVNRACWAALRALDNVEWFGPLATASLAETDGQRRADLRQLPRRLARDLVAFHAWAHKLKRIKKYWDRTKDAYPIGYPVVRKGWNLAVSDGRVRLEDPYPDTRLIGRHRRKIRRNIRRTAKLLTGPNAPKQPHLRLQGRRILGGEMKNVFHYLFFEWLRVLLCLARKLQAHLALVADVCGGEMPASE